ncbi:hypothetical protein QYE76_046037 [Lolium multiflorum]|uniref:Reverse transcriptase domain-containing protein n=1 Tax=Lolium multiflorum TaxID=4521 RepID=A0AAD8WYT1_LOLMU|nr:hypothetical protein QYE76_046037 [Lolium multiflorum]
MLHYTWLNLSAKVGGRDIIDWWQFMSGSLRQQLRGWARNIGVGSKREKETLMTQIMQLDVQADSSGLNEDEWAQRYYLEDQLLQIAFAYRLDPIAHKTISLNQTAFIKGRNLLEGPLALIEIVHELRSKKLGGILLKLDFEKAYDRVNWEFLAELLRCKGFEEAYIHRVLQLVSGGQTSISINGVIGPYLRNKKGVRQGDPLSPLLFNFIAEALSGILSAAGAAGHLQGVVPI